MRTVFAVLFLFISSYLGAQTFQLTGEIIDDTGQPLASAVAVLLNPSDSTLMYFSVTGNTGRFEMKNIKPGGYLLQVSLLGFHTLYSRIEIPYEKGSDLGQLLLSKKVYNMNEVTVSGERIPMKIKQDTIEYNAKAFNVKPDGVAEDLVRKLPGIEVDRSGNIKAMGEDVKNVLVDGKEFFGNDPKVATRNLPADAIDKVQLFDKQTDESKFTGIDDGERNPTLNFVLEEGKKSGIFGDISAGAGTGDHLAASAKIYRFTKTSQLAGIGMFNNINQYGFSLNDYLNFSGGIASLMSGEGHIVLGNDSSFPVNFGQPVYGFGSNGAAGLNFSVSKSSDNRFFASYLGNGSKRDLSESSSQRNFIPDGSFALYETTRQTKRDTSHRVNFGIRKRIGERQNIIVNGGLSMGSNSNPFYSESESTINDVLTNTQIRSSNELTSRLSGNADGSYLLKVNEGKTIIKLAGRMNFSGSSSKSDFSNNTSYLNPFSTDVTDQFYNVNSSTATSSATLSLTQRVTKRSFADFSLAGGTTTDDLKRRQGLNEASMIPDQALSPDFSKTEKYIRPGLTWKLGTERSQWSLALMATAGEFTTSLNNDTGVKKNYFYLVPRASWEFDIRSGRRLMFDYSASINTPGSTQLLPVVNNINSLSLFYGNRDLDPEYIHNGRLTWWLFDQFSFTTLLTGFNFRYTGNKIGYVRNVSDDLVQTISLANMKDEINAGADADFSTPVKPLGIKINLALSENFQRGQSIINGTENTNTSFSHRVSLTIDNRKKDKWDISTGSTLTFTDSKYSVSNSMNNVYSDVSWFAEMRYTPGVHFNFRTSADITNYSARTFSESQLVPLIGAEVNYYFLKNQRAVLTLAGIDLLDRNKGIERRGELNYLVERRSEMLGRYFMLSFKYRLNKLGDNNSGVSIQMKSR